MHSLVDFVLEYTALLVDLRLLFPQRDFMTQHRPLPPAEPTPGLEATDARLTTRMQTDSSSFGGPPPLSALQRGQAEARGVASDGFSASQGSDLDEDDEDEDDEGSDKH